MLPGRKLKLAAIFIGPRKVAMVALAKPDNRILDTIIQGNCLDVLRTLDTCSVDAIVTDPPAGIGFMGVGWDTYGEGKGQARTDDQWDYTGSKEHPRTAQSTQRIVAKQGRAFRAFLTEVMAECLRVLKPGGHALIWALPRTSHWTTTAIEDAGFEIRDVLTHLFGSGFPKSMDISKAIDKMQGAEREVIGERQVSKDLTRNGTKGDMLVLGNAKATNIPITAPSTPQAQQWQGYGTALKPANEHWILARKPLSEKSIAENVLKWGTGGLNIDASRVGTQAYTQEQWTQKGLSRVTGNSYGEHKGSDTPVPQGRFPSNLLLSHSWLCTDEWCDEQCPIRLLDEQSKGTRADKPSASGLGGWRNQYVGGDTHAYYRGTSYHDQGGASRYFTQFCYTAKASRSERNRGCEGLPEQSPWTSFDGQYAKGRNPVTGERSEHEYKREQSNHHPTVKPLQLMSWLCRLITPPNGIVLDCFVGSGSTLVACVQEGFHFIGIEQSAEYVNIARARVAYVYGEVAE